MKDLLSNVPAKSTIQSNTTHHQQLAEEENTHILHRQEQAALRLRGRVPHGLLPLLHPVQAGVPLEELVCLLIVTTVILLLFREVTTVKGHLGLPADGHLTLGVVVMVVMVVAILIPLDLEFLIDPV